MGGFFATLFARPIFVAIGGAAKACGRWLFASSTHLLIAALGLALIFGLWERHELHKTQRALTSCDVARKADQAQWGRQVAAAKAATALAKQKGKDSADDAETYHTQLQAADGRLRDYAAAHRVRPIARAPDTPGSRRGDDTPVPSGTPAVPTVAVPESVLNTCDADYTYAAAAYRLGQSLITKGLAEPQK